MGQTPILPKPVYRAVVIGGPRVTSTRQSDGKPFSRSGPRTNDEAVRVLERAKGAEPRNGGFCLRRLGSAYLGVSNVQLALAYARTGGPPLVTHNPRNVRPRSSARAARTVGARRHTSPQDGVSAGS
jgi:hypothetical protein